MRSSICQAFHSSAAAVLVLSACGGTSGSSSSDKELKKLIFDRINEYAYECPDSNNQFFAIDTTRAYMTETKTNFEVSNLGFVVSPIEITEADKLNGVEHIIEVEFSPETAYRYRDWDVSFNVKRPSKWGEWTSWGHPGGVHTFRRTNGNWSYGHRGQGYMRWNLMRGLFRTEPRGIKGNSGC